jgi:acyl-CoA thioester hydrolase
MFTVHITVRGYELDSNGHLHRAVYLQYAEHARWELLRAAGIEQAALAAAAMGPVTLEERIRFRRELRAGDEVTVSCRVVWQDAKTFRVEQELRMADGTLAAEVTGVCGVLDLGRRRLVSRDEFAAALDPAPELLLS